MIRAGGPEGGPSGAPRLVLPALNRDGLVNVVDLVDLLLCFGQPPVPGCESEDVDGDGDINVLDLIELLLGFGTACP